MVKLRRAGPAPELESSSEDENDYSSSDDGANLSTLDEDDDGPCSSDDASDDSEADLLAVSERSRTQRAAVGGDAEAPLLAANFNAAVPGGVALAADDASTSCASSEGTLSDVDEAGASDEEGAASIEGDEESAQGGDPAQDNLFALLEGWAEEEEEDVTGEADSEGEQEERECWICFADGNGDWVAPCRTCSGSMGWLHRGCFAQWLATSWATACPNCARAYSLDLLQTSRAGRLLCRVLAQQQRPPAALAEPYVGRGRRGGGGRRTAPPDPHLPFPPQTNAWFSLGRVQVCMPADYLTPVGLLRAIWGLREEWLAAPPRSTDGIPMDLDDGEVRDVTLEYDAPDDILLDLEAEEAAAPPPPPPPPPPPQQQQQQQQQGFGLQALAAEARAWASRALGAGGAGGGWLAGHGGEGDEDSEEGEERQGDGTDYVMIRRRRPPAPAAPPHGVPWARGVPWAELLNVAVAGQQAEAMRRMGANPWAADHDVRDPVAAGAANNAAAAAAQRVGAQRAEQAAQRQTHAAQRQQQRVMQSFQERAHLGRQAAVPSRGARQAVPEQRASGRRR